MVNTNSEYSESTIDDIINEIKQNSEDGNYIYRGENNKEYCKISSTLYREYFNDEDPNIDFKGFDLRIAQREILNVAKKHIGQPPQGIFGDFTGRSIRKRFIDSPEPRSIIDSEELEILTELQHYGGKTNLIDFTTDYLIAIFFACDGCPTKDGRVILQRTELIEKTMIVRPQNPQRRVIAQKSVLLYPPDGFIDEFNLKMVYIPVYLKQQLLEFLRKYHNISAETIYNDLHGFIENQKIHHTANKEFYLGLTFQYRGYNGDKNDPERRKAYREAIKHYSRSIELDSENAAAYNNRGECWLHLEEWEKAWGDLMIAQDMGSENAAAFHRDYKRGPEEFQEKTGIQMPKPITVLLGH